MSQARLRHLRRISLVLLFTLLFGCVLCFASSSGDPSLLPNTPEVDQELSGSSSRDSGFVLQDVKTESLRISSSDTSGFHAVILGLIGDYNPIVKDYVYQSTQGYSSHSIEITPDWSWIASAAIFLCIIFCLFRLIGGIFSWKR